MLLILIIIIRIDRKNIIRYETIFIKLTTTITNGIKISR